MKRKASLSLSVTGLILFFPLLLLADVLFSGIVEDDRGRPRAGATVCVGGGTLCAESVAGGLFTVQGSPTALRPPAGADLRASALTFHRSEIRYTANDKHPVRLTLYDVRGRRVGSGRHEPGITRIPLSRPNGMYVLVVQTQNARDIVAFSLVNGMVSRTHMPSRVSPQDHSAASFAEQTALYHTLRASHPGYLDGYATARVDTLAGIVITLLDSASAGALSPFRNPSLPVAIRVADLINRMTTDEKIAQLRHDAAAIPRLGMGSYNYWNESLHGVGLNYLATVFPQAIGLAATFNTSLMDAVSRAIAVEARAKHHKELREYGNVRSMRGLTFFSPNINIFRDPRWGRGQETYGEDPFLTSRMAVSYIRGMQGNDSRYLLTAATAKHFAVHSGPESLRHSFDARVSRRDLFETYLPAFEAAVREGSAQSVMCSYNRIDGAYACQNAFFLDTILRKQWGFKGFVISDCGAPGSLEAGCDILCYLAWKGQNAFSAADGIDRIDTALTRIFTIRMALGMFDPPAQVPFASIPYSVVDCPEHRRLARRAARESIVLLRNRADALPLGKNISSLAVIGPHANTREIFWANYHGIPSYTITPLEGVKAAVSPTTTVRWTEGCKLADDSRAGFAAAESLAAVSDAVICVLGLSSESYWPTLEGEKTDRSTLGLPGVQQDLLTAVCAQGKPVILVLVNGSALDVSWADSNAAAIIESWYGGQEAGNAIADVLFGDYNPAGRLPVTFYRSTADLPAFDDYAIAGAGRTYRYFTGTPLYPFGHGLSYTSFAYSNCRVSPLSPASADTVILSVTVANTGTRGGDEVVQVYVSNPDAGETMPRRMLAGFSRIYLDKGQSQIVHIPLPPRVFTRVNNDGTRTRVSGSWTVAAGGGQPGNGAGTSTILVIP